MLGKFDLTQKEQTYKTYTTLISSIKKIIGKYKNTNTSEKEKAEKELKKLEQAKKDIHLKNKAKTVETQIANLYKLLKKSIYFRDIKKNYFTGDPKKFYVIIRKTKTKDGIKFEYLVDTDGIELEEPIKRTLRPRKQIGTQMQSIFADDSVVWIIENDKPLQKQYGDIKNQIDDNDIYGTQDEAEKEIKYKKSQKKTDKKDKDYQIDVDDTEQEKQDAEELKKLQKQNCTPQFDGLEVIETVLDGNCFFDAVLKFMKNNGSTNPRFIEIWNSSNTDTNRCSIFRTKLAEFLDVLPMTYTTMPGYSAASDVPTYETGVDDKKSHQDHLLNSSEYAQDYDSALVSKYLDVCIFTYNLDGTPITDRFYNQNQCVNKEKVLVLYCGQGNSKHYKTFKVKDGYEINNQGKVDEVASTTSEGQSGPVPFKIELEY